MLTAVPHTRLFERVGTKVVGGGEMNFLFLIHLRLRTVLPNLYRVGRS